MAVRRTTTSKKSPTVTSKVELAERIYGTYLDAVKQMSAARDSAQIDNAATAMVESAKVRTKREADSQLSKTQLKSLYAVAAKKRGLI